MLCERLRRELRTLSMGVKAVVDLGACLLERDLEGSGGEGALRILRAGLRAVEDGDVVGFWFCFNDGENVSSDSGCGGRFTSFVLSVSGWVFVGAGVGEFVPLT